MRKCFKCNKMAVWYYMPWSLRKDNSYYCDNCISRGCSCNFDDDGKDLIKDEFGRDLPCIEYEYCETGFEDEN